MSDALLVEVSDRVRRIETKLSRYIAGEDDRGVTKIQYELDEVEETFFRLHLHTGNITLAQLSKILTDKLVPPDADVEIYDDGRFLMSVVMR